MILNDRHVRGETTGQSLVEFALVIPIFLLVFASLFDIGRLVYMNSVLSQAAREGARVGSVEASWIGSNDPSCGASGGPVCPAAVAGGNSLQADVTTAANRMVAPFGSVQHVYISCNPAGSAPTGAWTTGSPGVSPCSSNNLTGNVLSVRVDLTFSAITPIVSQVVGPVTTSGSATVVIN